jgi:hypothetical protein
MDLIDMAQRRDIKGIHHYCKDNIKPFIENNFKGSGLTRELLNGSCSLIINRSSKKEKNPDKLEIVTTLVMEYFSRVDTLCNT